MKIQTILTEHRFDFTATLQCEHCGATQHLATGYHDSYYHGQVMPAITCKACGKNRAGEVPAEANDDGRKPVFIVNTRGCKPMTAETAEALARMAEAVYEKHTEHDHAR